MGSLWDMGKPGILKSKFCIPFEDISLSKGRIYYLQLLKTIYPLNHSYFRSPDEDVTLMSTGKTKLLKKPGS
jgi:hypothetical protein